MRDQESELREALAYWFFRLNGCFVIPNFLLHKAGGGGQLTEFDLLAIRFPHRSELASTGSPMCDDPITEGANSPQLFIVECAGGRCKVNELWGKKERDKVEHLLDAVGIVPA